MQCTNIWWFNVPKFYHTRYLHIHIHCTYILSYHAPTFYHTMYLHFIIQCTYMCLYNVPYLMIQCIYTLSYNVPKFYHTYILSHNVPTFDDSMHTHFIIQCTHILLYLYLITQCIPTLIIHCLPMFDLTQCTCILSCNVPSFDHTFQHRALLATSKLTLCQGWGGQRSVSFLVSCHS